MPTSPRVCPGGKFVNEFFIENEQDPFGVAKASNGNYYICGHATSRVYVYAYDAAAKQYKKVKSWLPADSASYSVLYLYPAPL